MSFFKFFKLRKKQLNDEADQLMKTMKTLQAQCLNRTLDNDMIKKARDTIEKKTSPAINKLNNYLLHHSSPLLHYALILLCKTKEETLDMLNKMRIKNDAEALIQNMREFNKELASMTPTKREIVKCGNTVEVNTCLMIQKLEKYLSDLSMQPLLLSFYEVKREIFTKLQQLMPLPTNAREVNTKIAHQLIIEKCNNAIIELQPENKEVVSPKLGWS